MYCEKDKWRQKAISLGIDTHSTKYIWCAFYLVGCDLLLIKCYYIWKKGPKMKIYLLSLITLSKTVPVWKFYVTMLLNYESSSCMWDNKDLTHCDLVMPYDDIALGQLCLTAPSHPLKQGWIIVNKVLWHSFEGNFTRNAQDICLSYEFEKWLI